MIYPASSLPGSSSVSLAHVVPCIFFPSEGSGRHLFLVWSWAVPHAQDLSTEDYSLTTPSPSGTQNPDRSHWLYWGQRGTPRTGNPDLDPMRQNWRCSWGLFLALIDVVASHVVPFLRALEIQDLDLLHQGDHIWFGNGIACSWGKNRCSQVLSSVVYKKMSIMFLNIAIQKQIKKPMKFLGQLSRF